MEQVYCDLNAVVEDEKEAKEGASFLGISNFGENNMFIVNKDLAGSGNMTKNDSNKLWRGLNKMLEANPDKKYFGLLFSAGHGMMYEGR